MKSETFNFNEIPKTVSELSALPEAVLQTPFQAAALTVLALCSYCDDAQAGIDMLNFLKGPQPLTEYEKQFLKDRLTDKSYVAYSYFDGTCPQNNYAPSKPFSVTIIEGPYSYSEEGYAKLLIMSSGADTPRPITLRRKGQEQWFLWEQFLLSDIRQPIAADAWA